ncbi:MAG: hypothetical protein A2945_02770 [Candidatus Liptonbacteria bacterium RIFCSPLOWO2_01_FULL_52_25]|uniref:Homing endonuclease LAGLIDADG domain-containing protein n=1 Tax=Candidatus Liptonbacteria bacterium RIFCSPLOWO2_01_FULL_52_25 TaxID=1798650 RepID=A0A1G2CCD5_9BACT|nr:MAG: hypothetical protein A2945_02770 [Candidatus Liptonbacteria bacterium RIFCSPLOWO2_01_FULL_52_25]
MRVIPREVQAFATKSTPIREMRSALTLSVLQREALVGSILGDGCLVANSWKKNYRLKMDHCDFQRRYLLWKYEIFKNFTLSPPRKREQTNAWSFRTISHPVLTQYRNLFYPNGKKVVPESINELLTAPISIAVWYMDDGALNWRKDALLLNTQSFTYEENERLRQCLKDNFGIEVTIMRNKKYWVLYIRKQYAPVFMRLVKRHVTDLMSEKLLVTP